MRPGTVSSRQQLVEYVSNSIGDLHDAEDKRDEIVDKIVCEIKTRADEMNVEYGQAGWEEVLGSLWPDDLNGDKSFFALLEQAVHAVA
jgi:hypothetical protein